MKFKSEKTRGKGESFRSEAISGLWGKFFFFKKKKRPDPWNRVRGTVHKNKDSPWKHGMVSVLTQVEYDKCITYNEQMTLLTVLLTKNEREF